MKTSGKTSVGYIRLLYYQASSRNILQVQLGPNVLLSLLLDGAPFDVRNGQTYHLECLNFKTLYKQAEE